MKVAIYMAEFIPPARDLELGLCCTQPMIARSPQPPAFCLFQSNRLIVYAGAIGQPQIDDISMVPYPLVQKGINRTVRIQCMVGKFSFVFCKTPQREERTSGFSVFRNWTATNIWRLARLPTLVVCYPCNKSYGSETSRNVLGYGWGRQAGMTL